MDTMPQLHPEYITDDEGNKKAVILPIEEYRELLEDLEDLAIAAQRRTDSTISHDDLLTDLRKDGFLSD